MHLLERANVKDVHAGVGTRGGHVVSSSVDSNGPNGSLVGEHGDHRRSHVWRPQSDGSIAVANVDYGIAAVLGHGRGGTELGALHGDELTGRSVLVLEVAGVSDGCENKVIGEELHCRDLNVLLEAMDLGSLLVVDVDVLLLRDGKEVFVVQPPAPLARRPH